MVARVLIRVAYRTCAFLLRQLFRLCCVAEAAESTVVESSLPLGQMPERIPAVEAPLASMTEEEGAVDEEVELDVEEGVAESGDGQREHGEIEVRQDSRLECWEWPHDWEDLDWDEEMWLEDERSLVSINEAVLPDELWE
jgi:hypothetical protein